MFGTKAPKKAPDEPLPTVAPLSSRPEYAMLLVRLQRLEKEEARLASKINRHRPQDKRDELIAAAASTLAKGEDVAIDILGDSDTLEHLGAELAVIRQATEIVRREMAALRKSYLDAEIERLGETHKKLAGRVALALAELMKANEAEFQLRHLLKTAELADDDNAIPSKAFAPGGFTDDSNSAAAVYLLSLKRDGFIAGSEAFLAPIDLFARDQSA